MGLQQDFAWPIATAGPPGHLHQQLGHALRGTEVGAEQSAIAVQDADQGHVGEMMALGQHLGADQDVQAAPVDAVQHGVQGAAASDPVPIDPLAHRRGALRSEGRRLRDVVGQGSAPEVERIDGRVVLDAAAHYEFTPQSRLYGRLDNALNTEYIASRRPFGARPGRPLQVMLGYKHSFGP